MSRARDGARDLRIQAAATDRHNNTNGRTEYAESIQVSIGIPDGKQPLNLRRGPAARRRRPAAAAVTAEASRRAISA